jgi:hypothetical protein
VAATAGGIPVKEASDASPIAFRLGQVDALAKTMLASPALYSPEMRASLALHWLNRAWQQYRQDRAITLGPALIGAECTAERNAFLTLFEQALPPREKHLCQAIRTVRKVAIRPMTSEIADAEAIVVASADELERVLTALAQPKLSNAPLERLLALVDGFRYSTGDDPDPLSATARTPCWAINLAAAARGDLFHLSETALPFPGLAQRRLFRADRGAQDRRSDARESLLEALHATACDIVRLPRAAEVFVREFPKQRTNSRLYLTWMLLFGLGGLTPAQLARALPATKAGAGKLLRQLEARHLAHSQGPFAPFLCNLNIPVAMPDWRYPSPD